MGSDRNTGENVAISQDTFETVSPQETSETECMIEEMLSLQLLVGEQDSG